MVPEDSIAPLDGVAVVIPCYNAGGRLRPVVEQVLTHTPQVIVVDDGSTDGSAPSLAGLPVRMVSFAANRGKGHALLAGFQAALEDPALKAVAVIDADGQHDPDELPGLCAALWQEDAGLVVGSRRFDGVEVPWRSRFGNRVSAALLRRILGAHLSDSQCGYRVLSRAFTEKVVQTIQGGRYETETAIIILAVRAGYRVVSAPIATRYESGNPSSHFRKLRDSWRVMRVLFGATSGRARRGARNIGTGNRLE
ncbi:glycosyltransferase family 2 protein [Roseovarius pacificus]|uniref:glycosyltransferase family 2 protein n=1 Tax=Roseovarius pacificus TaxID=337701 RepID=UPI002A186C8D|nr:glycosyltransferase family 2 protein [Roseovarius pacificus]